MQLFKVRRGISGPITPKLQKRLLDLLIDRTIVETWVRAEELRPNRKQLARQVALTRATIDRQGLQSDQFLKSIGMTDKSLQTALEGTVCWNQYIAKKLTNDSIRAEFRRNRARYDDTRVRAQQIFLKVSAEKKTERAAALRKLLALKKQLESGDEDFSELARRESQSPSSRQGGDVGFFAWHGQMPAEVTAAAFALKVGDISKPIESAFGVHLLKVTDRRDGTLSPEDARPQIVAAISQREWNAILQREKKLAKISRGDN